ncbi:unnamed protein product [Cylicostephanus goldi]|uniref:Transferrin receptor-like dimerisation domain-containing protein n=1 Tax=Cylicostephanus goldi TaxID=71465 RepID=A0A3P6SLX3_CYLGO|nr:unnamed protein product [Cylicostephanus goldi]
MASIGRLWLEIAHRLASSLVIPFNVLDYAQSLLVLFHKVEVQVAKLDIVKEAPWLPHKLSSLKEALRRFYNTARRIQMEAEDITNAATDVTPQRLESINFRLQHIERSFIDINSQNPYYKHLVFSPSSQTSRFTSFSSILDPALYYHLFRNETDLHNLAMAITKVQYAVETAIDTLH